MSIETPTSRISSKISQYVTDQINEGNGTIKLADLNLSQFPKEILDLIKDTVERLSLQTNILKVLPSTFNKLTKLRYLNLHENNFTEFPNIICYIPNLEILDMSENQLRKLPTKIGNLKNLKVLSLKNNNFEYIPSIISEMNNLRIFEINDNPLIMPTIKFIQGLQNDVSTDWIDELKRYLKENAIYLDTKIQEIEIEDVLQRSKSTNEVKPSSTRASKRMGLIIRRPDDLGNKDDQQQIPNPNPNININQRSRSSTISKEFEMLEKNGKIDTEHKSGAYFRRLSTLQEITNSLSQFKIIEISRKILFSFSELHSSIRRFTGFCSDKKITIKMVTLLYNAKAQIDHLVESLESIEEKVSTTILIDQVLNSVISSINSFKTIMTLLQENIVSFTNKTDVCFIRMLLLTIFGSLNELFNAYKILNPSVSSSSSNSTIPQFSINSKSNTTLQNLQYQHSNQSLSINTQLNSNANPNSNQDYDEMDDRLYECIDLATSSAQTVFSELTDAIGKSALQSAQHESNQNGQSPNHLTASKVKEITNVLMSAMEITKRLRSRLLTIKNDNPFAKKKFWEDTNSFLKAVISILSISKQAMSELPILNDVRNSMASLTKATKDVTIMLEVSSYRYMVTDSANPNFPPPLSSIPSVSNILHQQIGQNQNSQVQQQSQQQSQQQNQQQNQL